MLPPSLNLFGPALLLLTPTMSGTLQKTARIINQAIISNDSFCQALDIRLATSTF
jgi:hypothetical protein